MSENWQEIDKEWQSLSTEEKLALITDRKGLRSHGESRDKSVVIVGAGMAGLVAAYELKRAGFRNIRILEARQRVGGRIRTIREPFTEGLYGEAGAMRIPESHHLTMAYVKNAHKRVADALMKRNQSRHAIKMEPLAKYRFRLDDKNAFCFFKGKRKTWKKYETEVKGGKDCFDFNVDDNEKSKTMKQLFGETVLEPLKKELEHRMNKGKSHDEALDSLMKEAPIDIREGRMKINLHAYSTRRFLREVKDWSDNAITAFGLLENQQARMNNGVVALLREYLTDSFDKLWQIYGGMDRLPNSFLEDLRDNITFGAKVEHLETDKDGKPIIRYTTSSGEPWTETAEFAIITLPFPMMRHIEAIDPENKRELFCSGKQTAIQGLNYSAAGKILFQCKRRFWEDDGISGGRTQTDLGIRTVWYPTRHPTKDQPVHDPDKKRSDRAILLVSYTWGRDSRYWTHLPPNERIRYAFKELAKIHTDLEDHPEWIEGGYTIMWQDDEFSGGAFALNNPYQEIHAAACRQPEGQFHFAGEHTSLNYHRWIEGAVESGLRAAYEVYRAP